MQAELIAIREYRSDDANRTDILEHVGADAFQLTKASDDPAQSTEVETLDT
jgi:hypothetical protein